MPAKKYYVILTQEQREQAEIVARSYKHKEAERKRARILLLSDAKHPDGAHDNETIREQVKVSHATVQNVRQRFVMGGLQAALVRKEQTKRKARVPRWRGRSLPDCYRLLNSARRPRALDAVSVGGQTHRAGLRRGRQP